MEKGGTSSGKSAKYGHEGTLHGSLTGVGDLLAVLPTVVRVIHSARSVTDGPTTGVNEDTMEGRGDNYQTKVPREAGLR